MHLHAGHNMVGYMPESEPLCSGNWEGAKNYMIGEILWQADQTDDWDQAEELSSAAEDLNLHDGPEWGTIVGNVSYWINQTDEECEHVD